MHFFQNKNGIDHLIAWGESLFQDGLNMNGNASTTLQPFASKQKHLPTVYELIHNPFGNYTFTTVGTAKLCALSSNTTPIASNSSGGCLIPTANHAYTLWLWFLLVPSLLLTRRKHRNKINVFTHKG